MILSNNLSLILLVFFFWTEQKSRSFLSSSRQISMNEMVPNKIRKIDSDKLDDMGVWKAIISSPQTIIEKFDDLKHTPRVWIGQLECSIVAVVVSIETHALGVFPFGFQNESSKWLLKFDS